MELVFGSGHNMEGQLGRGTGKKIARKFERISVSEGVVAVAVATGYEHSLFLDEYVPKLTTYPVPF